MTRSLNCALPAKARTQAFFGAIAKGVRASYTPDCHRDGGSGRPDFSPRRPLALQTAFAEQVQLIESLAGHLDAASELLDGRQWIVLDDR